MIKSKSTIVTRTKISMKLTVMVVIKELDMLLLVLLVMAPCFEKKAFQSIYRIHSREQIPSFSIMHV